MTLAGSPTWRYPAGPLPPLATVRAGRLRLRAIGERLARAPEELHVTLPSQSPLTAATQTVTVTLAYLVS